jgi:hypothetical protein
VIVQRLLLERFNLYNFSKFPKSALSDVDCIKAFGLSVALLVSSRFLFLLLYYLLLIVRSYDTTNTLSENRYVSVHSITFCQSNHLNSVLFFGNLTRACFHFTVIYV